MYSATSAKALASRASERLARAAPAPRINALFIPPRTALPLRSRIKPHARTWQSCPPKRWTLPTASTAVRQLLVGAGLQHLQQTCAELGAKSIEDLRLASGGGLLSVANGFKPVEALKLQVVLGKRQREEAAPPAARPPPPPPSPPPAPVPAPQAIESTPSPVFDAKSRALALSMEVVDDEEVPDDWKAAPRRAVARRGGARAAGQLQGRRHHAGDVEGRRRRGHAAARRREGGPRHHVRRALPIHTYRGPGEAGGAPRRARVSACAGAPGVGL